MALEDFDTSDSPESEDSDSTNYPLNDPEDVDTPQFVSLWISDDGLLAQMEVKPDYFRDNVSTDVKDRAKDKGLIYLSELGESPTIALTDDPEKYGCLLEMFGLEDYLIKRIEGVI